MRFQTDFKVTTTLPSSLQCIRDPSCSALAKAWVVQHLPRLFDFSHSRGSFVGPIGISPSSQGVRRLLVCFRAINIFYLVKRPLKPFVQFISVKSWEFRVVWIQTLCQIDIFVCKYSVICLLCNCLLLFCLIVKVVIMVVVFACVCLCVWCVWYGWVWGGYMCICVCVSMCICDVCVRCGWLCVCEVYVYLCVWVCVYVMCVRYVCIYVYGVGECVCVCEVHVYLRVCEYVSVVCVSLCAFVRYVYICMCECVSVWCGWVCVCMRYVCICVYGGVQCVWMCVSSYMWRSKDNCHEFLFSFYQWIQTLNSGFPAYTTSTLNPESTLWCF